MSTLGSTQGMSHCPGQWPKTPGCFLLPERKTQGSYLLSVHLIYRKGRGPRHAKAGLKLLLGCPATAPICLQAPLPHLGGAEAGQQAYCLHTLPTRNAWSVPASWLPLCLSRNFSFGFRVRDSCSSPPSQPLAHHQETGGCGDGDGARQGLMRLCHHFINPEGVSGPPAIHDLHIKVFSSSGLPDLVPIAHPEQSESMKHSAALINK